MKNYRKLYNANLFGTSDVSILKFYYASYKIQESKGKVSNVSEFIDICADSAASTGKMAAFLELIPLIPSGYSTHLKRIAKIMTLRRLEVEALFQKDNISDEEFDNFCIGKHEIKPTLSKEEKLEKVKEYITICNSKRGLMQLGDRIFGYLLKSEIIGVYSPSEREGAWINFIGEGIKPSNMKLIGKPNENRNEAGKKQTALIRDLKKIYTFYNSLELNEVANLVQIDLQEQVELSKKITIFKSS